MVCHSNLSHRLEDYLAEPLQPEASGIPVASHLVYSQGMLANAYFFGHPQWGEKYFLQESYNRFWESRWREVIPNWDGKIVVDIGCGPGNVYATLGGKPALMIGVDISLGALKLAQRVGYSALLADAQALPLKSGFADVVTLNATVHHCDNMVAVLQEAARLLKPGGLLVSDLDPQISARNYQGLGLWFDQIRRTRLRELLRPSQRRSKAEVSARAASEIHNFSPGDGVTPALYQSVLVSLGFDIALYPHNHQVGAETFRGDGGKAPWYIRTAQRLSGIDPDYVAAAQSIMCVARR
ncbi:MAG: class I SAM-dependent methyltransferase [Cyanobacteria bacterium P01_A01_bin.135]